MYFSVGGGYTGYMQAAGLYFKAYYDTDNGSYYLNPADATTSLIVAGNVGIGSATPGTRLDVAGDIRSSGTLYGSAILQLGTSPNFGGWQYNNAAQDYLSSLNGLKVYTAAQLAANTGLSVGYGATTNPADSGGAIIAGNTGIGTSNPTALLDIAGTYATGSTSLRLRSGDNSTIPADAYQILFSYNSGTSYTHDIRTRHNSTAAANNAIDFYVWNYGVDAATTVGTKHVLTMDGTGVGIGTTAPADMLHVSNGTARFANTADVNQQLEIRHDNTAGGTNPYIRYDSSGNLVVDSSQGVLYLNLDSDNVVNIGGLVTMSRATSNTIFFGTTGVAAPGAGSSGEKLQLYGTAGTVGASDYALGIEGSNMWFNTDVGYKWYQDSAVKMVLTNGNVGIGTTNPGTNIASIASYPGKLIHLQNTGNRSTLILQSDTFSEMALSDTGAAADAKLVILRNDGGKFSIMPHSDNGATAINALVVDNLTGNVGIGTTSSGAYKFYVANGTGSNIASTFDVGYTTASANFGAIDIFRSGSNTVGDGISYLFSALDSGSARQEYAGVAGQIEANNAGSEKGRLVFMTTDNGSARSEKVRITSNGNVGIGATAPISKLAVGGNGVSGAGIYGTGSSYGVYGSGPSGVYGNSSSGYGVYSASKMYYNTSAGSYTNAVCTSASGFGAFGTCSSSARYKKDIVETDVGLDAVLQLSPKTFTWKYNDQTDYGFIAEDLEQINPMFVFYNEEGLVEGVKYDRLTAVLANAIQEQQLQINQLASDSASLALNSKGDLVINGSNGNYTVTDTTSGSLLTSIIGASKAVIAKITAGAIYTKELTADSITIGTQTLEQYIRGVIASTSAEATADKQEITAVHIETDTIQTKEVQINTSTDASASANITLEKDNAFAQLVIKIKNNTIARIDQSGNATFSGTLTAKDASVSGTLIAKEIRADNIQALTAQVNTLQSQLAYIGDTPLPLPDGYMSAEALVSENLTVTNLANIYDLSVAHTAIISQITIDGNNIGALSQQITFFNGELAIAQDGTLTTQSSVFALGGIKTDTITATNPNNDIAIKLSTGDTNTKLKIQNEAGTDVASIDASGSAYFAQGVDFDKFEASASAIIAAPQAWIEFGENTPAIKTNSQASGNAILPSGQSEILIANTKVKANSLVYVTATTSTNNQIIYVSAKKEGAWFKVKIDQPINQDITFNWWIL